MLATIILTKSPTYIFCKKRLFQKSLPWAKAVLQFTYSISLHIDYNTDGPNYDFGTACVDFRYSSSFSFILLQSPRSSGCRGCNCTRQFSAFSVLICTFFYFLLTLSSFSKIYCENVTFMTKMSLSSVHHLLATSFLHPSIETHYDTKALLS